MAKPSIFQPTPSLRRATTPRPSAPSPLTHFNPRPPCGGRRAGGRPADKEETYFNPRPPCGGRRRLLVPAATGTTISTHALLAEGDGGRIGRKNGGVLFQPTPSLRRATAPVEVTINLPSNFNPRPPCGGRREVPLSECGIYGISTHALLAEGDILFAAVHHSKFAISTHALLAEGDTSPRRRSRRYTNFNPRPPCGGRPRSVWSSSASTVFQPTPSLRRATHAERHVLADTGISTHALLAEGDMSARDPIPPV